MGRRLYANFGHTSEINPSPGTVYHTAAGRIDLLMCKFDTASKACSVSLLIPKFETFQFVGRVLSHDSVGSLEATYRNHRTRNGLGNSRDRERGCLTVFA